MTENAFFALLENVWGIWRYFLILAPLWMPPLLLKIFIDLWMKYVKLHYINKQGSVLLEIKLPKEITKSPKAMELVFMAIYETGSATYFDTYWDGKVKPFFSFEIASFGGDIRFFIWTWPKYKNTIEAQIYARYPSVEIYEVPDYTLPVRHDPENVEMWGTNYKLSDPVYYPIKTYVDYGLDKDPKEEFKIDPMTSVLEYLGSLNRGEQVWIQILIKAHKKEGLREGRLFKRPDWKKAAKEEIKKIKKEAEGDDDDKFPRQLTEGQKRKIEALERSIDKHPFDTAIRAMYIAKKEAFNEVNIPALIGSVRQYSSMDMNGIKLSRYTDHTDEAKDWITLFSWVPGLTKAMQKRRWKLEKNFLTAFKLRSFFFPPYKYFRHHPPKPMILTTEELATIYHFPGGVASTPTIPKTYSRKKEAPPDLPV